MVTMVKKIPNSVLSILSVRNFCVEAIATTAEAGAAANIISSSSSSPPSASPSLYSQLRALLPNNPGSVSMVLNKWASEGKGIKKYEMERLVKEFRRLKRYDHALQLIEWMENRGINLFSNFAVRIDLLSMAKGIKAAEEYFTGLSDLEKNQSTYGSLLNCYCREKMPDKAMEIFEKMREQNFITTPLPYNNLMTLYMRLNQPEKLPPLVEEMKAENISPDRFTYNLLMNSYASLNDIEAAERIMEEVEAMGNACRDWTTYTNLAAIYVAAGQSEKAELALKQCEKIINRRDRTTFHFLISLYAGISKSTEVKRVWQSLKSAFPKTANVSYLVMLQALNRLDDMDGLKECFDEWESVCLFYDIKLANVMMGSYLRRGMIKEAESIQERAANRGSKPNFRTLELFINSCLKNNSMELALKYMKIAVAQAEKKEWHPNQEKVKAFLKYFEQQRDTDGAEEFFQMLKKVSCLDLEVYNSLLRTYIAAEKMEPLMRKRIEEDGIEVSTETEELLQKVCP